jgi:site-specific recombinase XerD
MNLFYTSRDIPLYATTHVILEEDDPLLRQGSHDTMPLFLSAKTHARVPLQGGGYLIRNDAERATLHEVSPPDLRHRFGSRLATSVPLHRLAHIMGMTHLLPPRPLDEAHQAVETIAWV